MWRRAALLALTLALRVAVAAAPPPWPEDDSGVPEAVAWSHPIGDPPVSRGSPRCRGRCVDDGEAAGAPLGGMGAGTLGRTYRGDFARWHLRPGTHTHAPSCQGCCSTSNLDLENLEYIEHTCVGVGEVGQNKICETVKGQAGESTRALRAGRLV